MRDCQHFEYPPLVKRNYNVASSRDELLLCHADSFPQVGLWRYPCGFRTAPLPQTLVPGRLSRFAQIGFGPLAATSTSNKVAVLRTLTAMVVSGSDTTGCRSASASRRVLTLWS